MKLTYTKISNYRNLSDLEIHLNLSNNFIVGENNLGKSNFLLLLKILFTKKSFNLDDFTDASSPIEILFTIHLDEKEIGIFDDFFEPENENEITIKAIQSTADDAIEFWHETTNSRIQPSTIKCLNFLYYDSIRNPSNELTFNKSKGVGKFLHYIIKQHLQNSGDADIDFIDTTKTDDLTEYINTVISKLKAFDNYSIKATIEEDIENLLSNIYTLKDSNNRYVNQSGYGVQFFAIITLSILKKILEIKELKRERGIFDYTENDSDSDTKKAISLVIGFDEPEIHLHPYLQRSLIKYINRVLKNKEPDFVELIKTVFNLDSVIGQSIVATHSPSIILNDYTEIIRFYKKNNTLSVKSGSQIIIEDPLKKHLDMQFPFIKEAFFSRCVIVVEGVTEYSAIPIFAIKMGHDLDEHGICIIEAGGKESVDSILELLTKFEIPCLGILDKDDDPPNPNALIRQTSKRDFEAEIISIIDQGKGNILHDIIDLYNGKPRDQHNQITYKSYQPNLLQKLQTKYSSFIDQSLVLNSNLNFGNLSTTDKELKRLWYLAAFLKNKDIILGKIIGEHLDAPYIPSVYKTLILHAIQLSTS